MSRRACLIAFVCALPAVAHEGRPLEPDDAWVAWSWDPLIVGGLLLSAFLYWRGASTSRGIRRWEQACYWSGWTALVLALASPVHAVGEVLFSVHMTQHEVMMAAAAPLLVLGRPLVPYLWAIPEAYRSAVARPFRSHSAAGFWSWLKRPLVAFLFHFVALWAWHVPAAFEATLRNDAVHAAQHLSFLVSALVFWWSLIRGVSARNLGVGIVYLFGTAVHTSVLGALLTFSTMVWYPTYSDTAAWGLTPLEDQQLGGLIMWVPAGLTYLVAALVLLSRWLRESDAQLSYAEETTHV